MKNYTNIDIRNLLLKLGVSPHYKGYKYVREALLIIQEDTTVMLATTKILYPEIAKRYNTTSNSVDRCIRTVSEIAWINNPEFLKEITNCNLSSRPTVKIFLKILYDFLIKEC